MVARDPLHDLAHDHADLNRRVLALSARLEAMRSAAERMSVAEHASSQELVGSLDEIRERLFLHFAQEEEGLFPFVSEAAGELALQVRAMAVAHDMICGALARMFQLASVDAPLSSIVVLFERFETAYAEHARTESALLHDLERLLDVEQRRRLAALVAGI